MNIAFSVVIWSGTWVQRTKLEHLQQFSNKYFPFTDIKKGCFPSPMF
jgi:hypothetical protein